ncbi:MAG: tyrosine-type recombinase/integrase [Geobacteraceae bacterium]
MSINVALRPVKVRGRITYRLQHIEGWYVECFDYFFDHLLENGYASNTRKAYCENIRDFIDYIFEVAKWASAEGIAFITVDLLIIAIEVYLKVISGQNNVKDSAMSETANDNRNDLSDKLIYTMQSKLCLKRLAKGSQTQANAAVTLFLTLSESFNIRMRELGSVYIDFPVFSETELFYHPSDRVLLGSQERFQLNQKSFLAGVVAGGPKFITKKRRAFLKSSINNTTIQVNLNDDAMTFIDAQKLLNGGFNLYRDKAFFSLLAAAGLRFSEGLFLTLDDIDTERRHVFVRDPKSRNSEYYNNYFTDDEIEDLPWKGRTTPYTMLIEPFASLFWKNLELYLLSEEFLPTTKHNFVFQLTSGINRIEPFFTTHSKNIRQLFYNATLAILGKVWNIHSLRHMYGVYCKNFFPLREGVYGLSDATVQNLMGHTSVESTKKYAKPDIEMLTLAQKMHFATLNDYCVFYDINETKIRIMQKQIEMIEEEIGKLQSEKAKNELMFMAQGQINVL